MLLTMEKILFLRTVPIFEHMSGDELRYLAEIAEEKDLPNGSIIFNENDIGDMMYIIVKGKVKIFTETHDEHKTLAILEERECFGEMSILDDETRSASAQAIEDVTFLEITREEFRELIREEPEVAFGVFKIFTKRLRKANIEHDTPSIPVHGSV